MTGLLTARQVADWLDVDVETVLRWTRRGTLPGHRMPSGELRFRKDGSTLDREAGDAQTRKRQPPRRAPPCEYATWRQPPP